MPKIYKMPQESLSFKQKLLYGLLFAVVGVVVYYLIDYFNERESSMYLYGLNFIIFWVLGFILVKKKKKNK